MVKQCSVVGSAAALALLLAGCGADLGECDMTKLGGNSTQGMLAPHDGQRVINGSCANGSCHSETATGKARNGAPAGLDFDVLPGSTNELDVQRAVRGGGVVHNEMEEMWELIDSGAMPPEGKRAALSSTEKESVRNWLACGAEVVAVPSTMGPVGPDLTQIHAALGDTCKACHTAGPDNNFMSGDACAMFNSLVGKTSMSADGCKSTGMMLVVPGQPDQSLFLKKLLVQSATEKVPCGMTMPFGNPMPLAASNPALVESIRMWIAAGALKPAGCP